MLRSTLFFILLVTGLAWQCKSKSISETSEKTDERTSLALDANAPKARVRINKKFKFFTIFFMFLNCGNHNGSLNLKHPFRGIREQFKYQLQIKAMILGVDLDVKRGKKRHFYDEI